MNLSKPWLLLPSQLAHDLSPYFLSLLAKTCKTKQYHWHPLEWNNLQFSNPLGISGGVDKNADNIKAWWTLGAGFIEVGTVTPKAQVANPGTIMKRHLASESLWNKMGFPNLGCEHVLQRLNELPRPYHTPLFVNVGKNRDTSLDNAHKDYIHCIERLSFAADCFVINISSPNTKDLRQLFTAEYLSQFLESIQNANQKNKNRPLLLKLSPDLDKQDIDIILAKSIEYKFAGWVFTNTTTQRPPGVNFPLEGGLSGRPLASISSRVLAQALAFLGQDRKNHLVVSSGGIMTPQDVLSRLEMGANLVQIYSALVFHGLSFFKDTANYMSTVFDNNSVSR